MARASYQVRLAGNETRLAVVTWMVGANVDPFILVPRGLITPASRLGEIGGLLELSHALHCSGHDRAPPACCAAGCETHLYPMTSLSNAAALFVIIHLGISGTTVRDRLVAGLGLPAYMVAFSVASVGVLVWMIMAYNAAPYLPTWGQLQWWKPVAIVLMLPAFLLVVIGLTTPNPTAVAQESFVARPPGGIVRITRHPFLVGVTIWALVHLIGNGDFASLLLFASLAIVAAAGTVSIDAKRRRALGPVVWDSFAGQTSILPFAAIMAGRTRLAAGELGWWRPAAGVAAYALMLGGHAHIIGVSPFPV